MELWNESFLRESSKPLYWRRDAAVNCLETDGFPFASTLEFHSLRAALTTIMFWALQLVLSSTIYHHLLFQLQPSQLEDINKNLGYSREPFYMKYSVSFMVGIAENIAGTVPYLMHPDMGTVACQRLLFPLRVAMSIFQPRPGPELAWFKFVFRKLASEKGIKFGEGIAKSGQTWGVSLSTERHVHEPEAPSHTEGTLLSTER